MALAATKIQEEFELGPLAAAAARSALERVGGHILPDMMEDVRLLVSELVTNSYRHAGLGPGATARLIVEIDDGRVRVEVEDGGRGFVPSVPLDAPRDRLSGWGLTIVDRVADRWGVTRDGGTHVWFELVTDSAESAARSA